MPTDLNRRALVAGAVTALPTIAALPTAAASLTHVPDPVFAAIEAHRQAYAAVVADLRHHSALEQELPQEKRQSQIYAHEEKIFETDDPRWIAAERALSDGWNLVEDAGCELVNIEPTSVAGVVALLHYVADQEAREDGAGLPGILEDEDDPALNKHGGSGSFAYLLPRHVARALEKMVV